MGMAFQDSRLVVASSIQITNFVDAAHGTPGASGYDALFVRQSATYTADLDVHDVAFDAEGRLVFVNTLFSCLATPARRTASGRCGSRPSSRGWRRRIDAT